MTYRAVESADGAIQECVVFFTAAPPMHLFDLAKYETSESEVTEIANFIDLRQSSTNTIDFPSGTNVNCVSCVKRIGGI